MLRRVAGIVVAGLALGAGWGWSAHEATRIRAEARTELDGAAAQSAKASSEILATMTEESATEAFSGAQLSQWKTILVQTGADTSTLHDFVVNEDAFSAYRMRGPTAVFLDQNITVSTGTFPEGLVTGELLQRAVTQPRGAGDLVAFQNSVVRLGAAKLAQTANGRIAVLVVMRPLDAAGLSRLSSGSRAVALTRGAEVAVAVTGAEAQLAAMKRWLVSHDDGCCASAPVSSSLSLVTAIDSAPVIAKAETSARRTSAVVLGAAVVVVLFALFFGFKPPGKAVPDASTALLEKTNDELKRTREEVARLSEKVERTTSGSQPALQLPPGTATNPGTGRVQTGNTVTGVGAPYGMQPLGAEVESTDPDAEPFAGTLQAKVSGRYNLVDLLGEGGMARVHVAEVLGAEGFRKLFVLKRLRVELTNNKDAVAQFIDEARLGSSLVHSNIIPVLDFGRDEQGYFMAQEYVVGRSIEALVAKLWKVRGEALPLPLILYIAQEALKALSAAHLHRDERGTLLGIVHRDVSPTNLMVSVRGEVKLLDFGIVKADRDRLTQTQAGSVKGNLFYMSPEQARGEQVDARTDLFSLGMVLFHAATAQTIYTGKTNYELLTRAGLGLTGGDRARIRALPDPLGPLLERVLQNDADMRFSSAEDFLEALTSAGKIGTAAELQKLVDVLFRDDFAKEQQRFGRRQES